MKQKALPYYVAKLNMLKALPLVYEECMARLELDGLTDLTRLDDVQLRRFNRTMDFFYDRFSLERYRVL